MAPKAATTTKRGRGADADDESESGPGDNQFDPNGEDLEDLYERVAKNDRMVDSLNEKIRLKVQPERDKIKKIREAQKKAVDKLVDDGYPTSVLKAFLRKRRMIAQAENTADGLDTKLKRQFERAEQAWLDFRGSAPMLGKAGVVAADE